MASIHSALSKLGFSENESILYVALLRHKRANVTTIAKHAGLPRTTVYTGLFKLAERGMVSKVKVGNHEEWEALSPQKLKHKIQQGIQEVEENIPELEKIYGLVHEEIKDKGFRIYETKTGLLHVYHEMLRLKKGEIVYIIEGVDSIKEKYTIFPENEFILWQDLFKKKGIILNAVTGEESLDDVKTWSKSVRDAHKGRRVIISLLPRSTLNIPGDIIVFRNTTIVTLPRKNTAVVMENAEIALIFKKLQNTLNHFGRKFDLNDWLEQLP